MGKMPPSSQIHSQDAISGLQGSEIDCHVSAYPGVRLHIGMLRPEELLRALDSQVLDDIHVSVAAMVALAGIPFQGLVGEDAALHFQNCPAGEVRRCHKLDSEGLAR